MYAIFLKYNEAMILEYRVVLPEINSWHQAASPPRPTNPSPPLSLLPFAASPVRRRDGWRLFSSRMPGGFVRVGSCRAVPRRVAVRWLSPPCFSHSLPLTAYGASGQSLRVQPPPPPHPHPAPPLHLAPRVEKLKSSGWFREGMQWHHD